MILLPPLATRTLPRIGCERGNSSSLSSFAKPSSLVRKGGLEPTRPRSLGAVRIRRLAFQGRLRFPGRVPRLVPMAAAARSSLALSPRAYGVSRPSRPPSPPSQNLQVWCERGDSNPHGLPHRILSPARLPVPPLSRGHHPSAGQAPDPPRQAPAPVSPPLRNTPCLPVGLGLWLPREAMAGWTRKVVVRPPRLERGTCGFEGRRSIQLSYGRRAERVTRTALYITEWLRVAMGRKRPSRTTAAAGHQERSITGRCSAPGNPAPPSPYTRISWRWLPQVPTRRGRRCMPSLGAGHLWVTTASDTPICRSRSMI